jgi:hypothetical protein
MIAHANLYREHSDPYLSSPQRMILVGIISRAVQDMLASVRAGVIAHGAVVPSRFDQDGRLRACPDAGPYWTDNPASARYDRPKVNYMATQSEFDNLVKFFRNWFVAFATEARLPCDPNRALANILAWGPDNMPPSYRLVCIRAGVTGDDQVEVEEPMEMEDAR